MSSIPANSKMYPHIYELELRGGVNSEEGEKYAKEHSHILDIEYQEILDFYFKRGDIGGTDKIHKHDLS